MGYDDFSVVSGGIEGRPVSIITPIGSSKKDGSFVVHGIDRIFYGPAVMLGHNDEHLNPTSISNLPMIDAAMNVEFVGAASIFLYTLLGHKPWIK